MSVVSIDIGSTWTKGAMLEVDTHDRLHIKRLVLTPTTPAYLAEGFFNTLNQILEVADARPLLSSSKVKLDYSSSAKGGLSVAAIGLVPSITLETAKVTAYSAGAKVTQHFAYRLNNSDLRNLEAAPPDILLFTGGTDGGDHRHVLHNARLLAQSTLDCAIIYAGNRDLQEEIRDILSDKDLTITKNVLPTLDKPNPQDARKAIGDIFLQKIVKGKGLDVIVQETGEEPMPTPYSVFGLVEQIRELIPGWQKFIMVDIGGATTDIYSSFDNQVQPNTVLHGVPEPVIKRTVEGDLGMRVSAWNAGDSGNLLVEQHFSQQQRKKEDFHNYLRHLTAKPGYLPQNTEEKEFDALLAGICVGYATERHAGKKTRMYTPAGYVDLQIGRDLSLINKVIGTGGWLSRAESFPMHNWLKYREIDNDARQVLLPGQFDYYRDTQGLIPLFANAARRFPKAAAQTAIQLLHRHTQ